MSATITLDALLDQLESPEGGETLVLPHGRAAAVRGAFDQRQQRRGLNVWRPAVALSWTQWLAGMYAGRIVEGKETRLLLNAAQEHALWRSVIAEDPPQETLGSFDAMAELAASALQRAAAWNAVGKLRGAEARNWTTHEDTRQFARWLEPFLRRCERDGLLCEAMLSAALGEAAEAGTLTLPGKLRLVSFNTFTPAQQAFLRVLEARETAVLAQELRYEGETEPARCFAAKDPQDELKTAARWMRRTLEAAQAAGKPCRIGLLVPGLAEERAAVEAALRATLAPELQSVQTDLSAAPWEISAGAPLHAVAMIADALDVVSWVKGPLPQARLTALLLSPYLNTDREAGAQIDAALRQRERPLRAEFRIDEVLEAVQRRGARLVWLENLGFEVKRAGELNKPRSHAEWADLLRRWVQATGWPGPRGLSATEFEATQAWDGMLDLIATLDFGGQRVTLQQAVAVLERQLSTTPFTGASLGAPVQVMTPEQAEGQVFDAVWFLRCTDANWPPREGTHPLLSWQLQRSQQMPGTDPALAMQHARAATAGLMQRSGRTVFSYAQEDADGQLRPSPLLAGLSLAAPEDFAWAAEPERVVYEETLDAEALPPLARPDVRGGASVLKEQAACGFRAFAAFRLNSTELELREDGFDARDSGNRVHGALQRMWRELKSQAELRRWREEQPERLDALLRACAGDAVMHRLLPRNAWDSAYAEVQTERLYFLLKQWTEHELARGPFQVVTTEGEQTVEVGPLRLQLRFDRIDRVEGGFLLVDYKTGEAGKPKDWESDRPDEPQLPLYALHYEPDEVAGLAFAKVRAGDKMRWHGIAAQEGILPGGSRSVAPVSEKLALWREVLTELAFAFAAGDARVAPKSHPSTCEHCAQRILCRLDVSALEESAANEETFGMEEEQDA